MLGRAGERQLGADWARAERTGGRAERAAGRAGVGHSGRPGARASGRRAGRGRAAGAQDARGRAAGAGRGARGGLLGGQCAPGPGWGFVHPDSVFGPVLLSTVPESLNEHCSLQNFFGKKNILIN